MVEAEGSLASRLVVVGASADGISALSVLVSTLPADFPAPVVIAQHLDPSRESRLGEILSRKSAMPVLTVEDHASLEPGAVYVVPANRNINITGGGIDASEEQTRHPKPSIDRLLDSAAEAAGERLVAVILTGTGSDGASGAVSVKKAGGTVIIQNPETAEYPAMPLALAPSTVDIVAELGRIGRVLQDLVAGISHPVEPRQRRMLDSLLEEMRERHGIDFTGYEMPAILRLLQRRIVATDTTDMEGYARYLAESPKEYQQLANAFLIRVTEFFRDEELFEYLGEEVIPRLIEEARERGSQLRFWSAGCATGEEAYSLAILAAEALGDELSRFSVRIFATDLDEKAVAFARRGIYSRQALSNLSGELTNRYFLQEDHEYQVSSLIRSMVVFGQHDLGQRAPFPGIDMVLSRNVLIYFNRQLQKRALQLFAYSLRYGGRLVLGKAESVSSLAEYFESEHYEQKVYRRTGGKFLMPPVLVPCPAPGMNSALSPRPRSREESASTRVLRERGRRWGRRALDEFASSLPFGLVVVDSRYDIQLVNDAARLMLSIQSPAVGKDLIHLLQGEAYTRLRPAIDAVFQDQTPDEIEDFVVEEPGGGRCRYLRMVAVPRYADGEHRAPEVVMVLINENTEQARERAELSRRLEGVSGELELEKEANRRLTEANRRLEKGNEELLVSIEEERAATEEVETLNEELQATNEELETLNEELQATIEELNSANDDLRTRGRELRESSRDGDRRQARLQAVLDNVEDAVAMIDDCGHTVLYNYAYLQIFDLEDPEFREVGGNPVPYRETPHRRAARGEGFSAEFTVATSEGELRRIELSVRPLREDSGLRGGVIVARVKSAGEIWRSREP